MEIRYVNTGIANNFDTHIEINENLKKYPNLLEPILKHELSHDKGRWSKKDFKLDFFSKSGVNSMELFKFMFKHPKSFSQLLPVIYRKKKGFIIDINLLIMYLIMITIFVVTISVGSKIL